jgi:hypothetical protein
MGYVTPRDDADRAARADPRVLLLKNDGSGQRHRDFRETVPLLQEGETQQWPVRGPRTAKWVLRHMADHAGTPIAWHTKWLHETRLEADPPSVVAHETACRLLHVMTCFDELDASNCAVGEIIARQVQLVEEKHRDAGSKKTQGDSASSDSHLYLGTTSTRGGLCICPALQDWISDELRREASVMKERRKAREEREIARPKKGPKDA